MSNPKIPVQNQGYVQLIAEGLKPEEISKIAGLSRRDGLPEVGDLIRWGHESPLEFSFWTFKIKAPIFVLRQLFRHRTGKFMEESLRYCGAVQECYIPPLLNEEQLTAFENAYNSAFQSYRALIRLNFDPEVARSVIPLGIYSTAYIGFDIRNLRNFLKLRLDHHAQKEIRDYAQVIYDLIPDEFKLEIPDGTE